MGLVWIIRQADCGNIPDCGVMVIPKDPSFVDIKRQSPSEVYNLYTLA